MFPLSLLVIDYAEYSQVNIILSNYLIIIFIAEQRKKIISAQDYLISQSGDAVSEFTRVGLNYLALSLLHSSKIT